MPVLTYYNPKKQTTLLTDASVKGLGACLQQHDRLVFFASKALINAHKGHMAIELESLALAWAMEKFHHFICQSFSTRNWPETTLSHIVKELESSNSKITVDTDHNICLAFYCKIYTWYY